MAYTHSKYEVALTATAAGDGLDLTATTFTGRWQPGLVPHIVRGVAVVFNVNTASSISAGVARFSHAKPVGTASTSATTIATLNFPTTLSLSTQPVIYDFPTVLVEIGPGEGINFNMNTAATTGIRGYAVAYVEPRWEQSGNISNMIETT